MVAGGETRDGGDGINDGSGVGGMLSSWISVRGGVNETETDASSATNTTYSWSSRDGVTVSSITGFKGMGFMFGEVIAIRFEGGELRRIFWKGDTKCVSLILRNWSYTRGVWFPGGSFLPSKPVAGTMVEPVVASFRISLG